MEATMSTTNQKIGEAVMETPSERWINLGEAAAHLKVSKSFLYQKGQALGIPRASFLGVSTATRSQTLIPGF